MQNKNWKDHVLEHPKLAGFLAFIALAVAFSPRVSGMASWICIAASVPFGLSMILGFAVKYHWRRGVKLSCSTLLVIGLIGFAIWLNGWKSEPTSDLAITRVQVLPFGVGLPMGASIFYINESSTTLSVQGYGGMYIQTGLSIAKEEDRRKLEESVWSDFIHDIKKDPPPPHMPVPGHIELHVTAPPSPPILRTAIPGNAVIYFLGLIQYKDATGIHESDVCYFVHGNPDVPFLCRDHNGTVRPAPLE